MKTITIRNRSLEMPILVPSVSSFETQVSPPSALRLQRALQEPISLVSAYDISLDGNLMPLCQEYRKNGILLLDSGGYESLRIYKYTNEQTQARWNFTKYAEVVYQDVYDFIFSFDYFIDNDETYSAFSKRFLRELRRHADIMDITKLIPVVHVRTLDGKRSLDINEIVDLVAQVASQLHTIFIAVPERELGYGIIARANMARRIVDAIRKEAEDRYLHILGCGNLLSFSLFAVAGAMMCDGLEWCRTVTAENFHLHHFQQADLFAEPRHYIGDPIAEFILSEAHLEYATMVAARNLMSLQAYTNGLHTRLHQRTVSEFVRQHFGETAGTAVRTLET